MSAGSELRTIKIVQPERYDATGAPRRETKQLLREWEARRPGLTTKTSMPSGYVVYERWKPEQRPVRATQAATSAVHVRSYASGMVGVSTDPGSCVINVSRTAHGEDFEHSDRPLRCPTEWNSRRELLTARAPQRRTDEKPDRTSTMKEDASLKAFIDDISDLLCMIWMLITRVLGAPAVQ